MSCNTRPPILSIPDQRNSTTIMVPVFRKTQDGRVPLSGITGLRLQVNAPDGTIPFVWQAVSGDVPGNWAITIPGGVLRSYVKKQIEATLLFELAGQTWHKRLSIDVK